MKVNFVTTNPHKFEEVRAILEPYGVELTQLDREYPENQDASLEEIAAGGAKMLADEIGEPVVTDDTGFYFDAYNEFPGVLSKFVYRALGYEGLLKLLEGKDRSARSRSVAAYGEPGTDPVTFVGEHYGTIAEDVYDSEKDVMPYARIFIPDGYDVPHSSLPPEEKNNISHRAIAFRKLGEYLRERHT